MQEIDAIVLRKNVPSENMDRGYRVAVEIYPDTGEMGAVSQWARYETLSQGRGQRRVLATTAISEQGYRALMNEAQRQIAAKADKGYIPVSARAEFREYAHLPESNPLKAHIAREARAQRAAHRADRASRLRDVATTLIGGGRGRGAFDF